MKSVFIAASLAFLAVSCAAPQSETTSTVASVPTSTSTQSCSDSSLAYIDMELVLSMSDIFESEGLALQKRSETMQRDLASKEQALQNEMAQLQQKYQSGLITSANAQKEQTSIESRAQAFQTSAQKQISELDEENSVFANRAQLLIRKAIENVNSGKKYKMIVNASALIDVDTTLNISYVVLDEFNKLYKEEKK